MSFLQVSGVGKKKGEDLILHQVTFEQKRFQKIAIAGETGSGKSTLLKIIAGLIQPDEGDVMFEQQRVLGPEEKLLPGYKSIAYLSQHFELRNNYRVEEELSYTNKLSDQEAADIYKVCQVNHLLKRKTDQLSGGEKQRIATARVLISKPVLLLLDEPFSNLDMVHKNTMKKVIHDIGEKLKITCMLISHDPLDTLSWAEEILVMRDGKVVQHGTPAQIYRQPVNEYAAGLFGKYSVIKPVHAKAFTGLAAFAITNKNVLVRPEEFRIVSHSINAVKAAVLQVTFFGAYYDVDVLVGNALISVRSNSGDFVVGQEVYVSMAD